VFLQLVKSGAKVQSFVNAKTMNILPPTWVLTWSHWSLWCQTVISKGSIKP